MELHLASMENITCWAFRKLCLGATDSFTGMMSMNYLIRRTKAWKEVDSFKIENQRQWLQVVTAKETECTEFLGRLNRELEADKEKQNLYGIQLNMSCPSPQVINLGQGSALVKRTKKAISLIQTLLNQEKFKISAKARLGLNFQDVKEGKIFDLLYELEKINDKNFSHLVIHLKHAREPSQTPYDYEILKEISNYKVPIIINGGIENYKDFNNIMKTLKPENRRNIKGIMLGREVLKNPDCFIPISNMLNSTLLQERGKNKINQEFNSLIKEHEPKEIYLKTIKQYCDWFN